MKENKKKKRRKELGQEGEKTRASIRKEQKNK